jgi:hypothetical protein
MDERRHEDRIKVDETEVFFLYEYRFCSASMLDISAGGARIKTFATLPRNSHIVLLLTAGKNLKLRAEIRWLAEGGFYRIYGLKFNELDRQAHIDLAIIVRTLYQDRPRLETQGT